MTVGGIEQDAYASDEMSLRDYWALARRRKWYIVVPVLFALGYSLATSMSTTPMYRAKADVLVQAAPVPGAVSSETSMTPRTLNNELLRAQGSALKGEARQQVGDEPTMRVNLAQDKDADLFVFTSESRSAQRAADAANTYANLYVLSRQADLAADFQSQADVLQQQLDDATERLAESSEGAGAEELRVIIAGYRADIDEVRTAAKLAEESGASVVNVAAAPKSPYAPEPIRSATLAILLGLIVGLAAAFLRDFTDNHIRTPEGLEKATGLPTAAVIPRLSGWKKSETHVVILEDSSSPQAEAYRSLRARIQFRRVDRQIRSLMVTSARPGEGKTTTSSNLAVAFAAAGENTVLVDLDMRRPRIHKFFGLSNEHGMSTVLLGADLQSAIRPLSSVPNLSVVPAGPSTGESSEILHDDALKDVLDQLGQQFTIVIVDTPPILAVADPLTISHYCDGTLLVVSASGTDKRDAELASNQLREVGVPMVGAVLNNYSAPATGYSYSYAYSSYTPNATQTGGTDAWYDTGANQTAQDLTNDEPGPSEPPKLSRKQRRALEKLSNEEAGAEGEGQPGAASWVDVDGPDPVEANPSLHVAAQHSEMLEVDIGSAPDSPAQTETVPAVRIAEIDAASIPNLGWNDLTESAPALDDTWQPVGAPTAAADYSAPSPPPSNGNGAAGEVDETGAEQSDPSSIKDYQEYLRAELRRAREEHAASGEAGSS